MLFYLIKCMDILFQQIKKQLRLTPKNAHGDATKYSALLCHKLSLLISRSFLNLPLSFNICYRADEIPAGQNILIINDPFWLVIQAGWWMKMNNLELHHVDIVHQKLGWGNNWESKRKSSKKKNLIVLHCEVVSCSLKMGHLHEVPSKHGFSDVHIIIPTVEVGAA